MRPMPEEVPALTGRTRLVAGAAVVLVVAAGLLLRFWTRSGLWLDEALTVDIARLPLHEIPNALKHDGAPPLYYYLLHFWIFPLRAVQRRRAGPVGPVRRGHAAGRLVLRAAPGPTPLAFPMATLTLFERAGSARGARPTCRCAHSRWASRSRLTARRDEPYSRRQQAKDVDQDEYASGRAQRAGTGVSRCLARR